MFALIFDKKVVEVSQSKFPVTKKMKWVECDESVKPGWFFVDNSFRSSLESDDKIIEQKKKDKFLQMDFLYDSDTIKKTAITIREKEYQLINDHRLRNLLFTKIAILQKKLDRNIVSQQDAIFSFVINEEIKIDLNIEELWEVLFFLDEDRQSKFQQCFDHKENIKALSSKKEIEEYKII